MREATRGQCRTLANGGDRLDAGCTDGRAEACDERAVAPITSASTITTQSTWRREAPSVRSVANSRVRCAIVIESELAITNEPTSSATPPKASRNFCRNETKPLVSSASFEAWALPVRTCVPGGRILLTWAIRCCGETPLFAEIRIWSSFPFLSNSF